MPNNFSGKGNLADAPTLKHVKVKGEDRTVAEMRVFDDHAFDPDTNEYSQRGGIWLQVSQWDQRGEDAARVLRKGARGCGWKEPAPVHVHRRRCGSGSAWLPGGGGRHHAVSWRVEGLRCGLLGNVW